MAASAQLEAVRAIFRSASSAGRSKRHAARERTGRIPGSPGGVTWRPGPDFAVEQHIGFHRPSADPMFQAGPVHQLHGDKRLPVLLAKIVNGANVRAVQCGSPATLSFPEEISTQRSGAAGCLRPYSFRRRPVAPQCGNERRPCRLESPRRAFAECLRIAETRKSTDGCTG